MCISVTEFLIGLCISVSEFLRAEAFDFPSCRFLGFHIVSTTFSLHISMENNSVDEQEKIASFAEIVGESADKARQFLQAANWKVEEAIELFYAQSDNQFVPYSSSSGARASHENQSEYVRSPLPVRREALYDNNYIRDSDQRSAPAEWYTGNDKLEALYRPPFGLMFKGSFEQAKIEAANQGKWLIANIQSKTEFSSYMLNKDTWANNAVKETIGASFIFWQIIDESEEGRKVCSYYHLTEMPSTLIIDSITGQKMNSWQGTISPQRFLEDLLPYMDNGPTDSQEQQQQLKDVLKSEYPDLPDEPEGDNKGENICRVGVRFPDGKRAMRKFLKTDPLQLLWSFCCSQVKEAADGRQFTLVHAVPGSSLATLCYDTNLTFLDCGLSNSLISMIWQ